MIRKYKKSLGQFFTPENLSQIMMEWIDPKPGNHILDPAIGTGNLILKSPDSIHITGFDIDQKCLNYVAQHRPSTDLRLENFLEYDFTQYDGIIANPPYLKYNSYSIPSSLKDVFFNEFGLRYEAKVNSYIIFVTKCIQHLKEGKKASFLIPSDWLKIKSGEAFKNWILSSGYMRHLIIFNEQIPVFKDNMSTACLLLMEKTKGSYEIRKLDYTSDLNLKNILEIKPETKINKVHKKNYVPLSEFVTIRRGIATGANSWFIQSQSKTNLPEDYLVKCIAKAYNIKNNKFTEYDWVDMGSPVLVQPDIHNEKCLDYIRQGEDQNIHLGYLTSKRKYWYKINLPSTPDYFLNVFTRSKFNFIENLCKAHSLTCFHYVYLKDKTLKNKFEKMILSDEFQQNAKDVMKVYAGGLMKLEPKMAEKIMVPNIRL